MTDREKILTKRAKVKQEYGKLYDEVSAILFRSDPIGINFETNADEYEPEVDTILPRLRDCNSMNEVRTVIYEEFVRWFDVDMAGAEEKYGSIAEEIWDAWKRFALK